MILSYDLLKNDNNANNKDIKELNDKERSYDLELFHNLSYDSTSQDPKSSPLHVLSLSGSDISKKEDYFIQKDLLKMINSFSANEADELRQSFNSLRLQQSINNDNNYNFLDSEWNENKVIDIKIINSFDQSDEEEEDKRSNMNTIAKGNNCHIEDSNNKGIKDYDNKDMAFQIKKTVNKQTILSTYTTFDNYELAKWSFLLSKDQKACIYLQSKLDEDDQMSELLYHNLKDKIIDLMFGGFSNYFIQKLIEKISKKYLEEIIMQIIKTNSFSILGLDPHGTRVLQKIIERVKKTNKLLGIITTSILQNINQFIFDSNANHIIIKYATIIAYPRNQIIYDFLVSNMLNISHDKNACCTLQKCIDVANETQREELYIAISKNAKVMISDDFGNYAIQFILPKCGKKILNQIVSAFLENADIFALNKYASNVIEKCLQYSDQEIRLIIIKKFMNEQSIMNLLFNKYGNYVLQTIISYANEPFLSVILSYIEKYSKQLNSKKFGQKFWNKLKKTYPQLNKNDNCNSGNSNNNNNMSWNNTLGMISAQQQQQQQNPIKKQQQKYFYQQQQQQNKYLPMQYQQQNVMNTLYSNNDMMMIGKQMSQLTEQQQQQISPILNYNSGNNIISDPSYFTQQNSMYLNTMSYDNNNNKDNNILLPQQIKQIKQIPGFSYPNVNPPLNKKQSKPPMNINIAVNNYYTSPIYNYYCFQNNQQQEKQSYINPQTNIK